MLKVGILGVGHLNHTVMHDSPQGRRAGYVFPPPVGRLRFLPAGPPRLLD